MAVSSTLFTIENLSWVLPKADWIRVFVEMVGLIAIAVLDLMQVNQNKRVWKEKEKQSRARRDVVHRNDRSSKGISRPWSPWAILPQSDKAVTLNRKRRKLTLLLLTLSCYMYIDATGASPMYHFEQLLYGLPIPGKQRKKVSSKVRR